MRLYYLYLSNMQNAKFLPIICQFNAMQCFLKYVYSFILIQMVLMSYKAIASITVLDKGLVSLHSNSVGLQFYVDIENQDRLSGCAIHSWAKNCCLTDGDDDCDTMIVYGGHHVVQPKDRDTLILVYPSLILHDLVGHCYFILDYQCGRNRRAKRQKVDVTFDTRTHTEGKKNNALLGHYTGSKTQICDTLDQDSLHDCEPVHCGMKYSDERPYYDGYIGKCVEAPICESNPDSELPDVVYLPIINTCRDLEHPLTVGDIYAISTGTGVVTQTPSVEEVKVEMRSNCSTISQNLKLIRDIMYGKLCPVQHGEVADYSPCCRSAVISILAYIGGVCALLLSFFCCMQTIAWMHENLTRGEFKKCSESFKNMFKKRKGPNSYGLGVSSEVRNTLLREVIVRDIPMELRDSIVNICERMDKDVKKKKRYRNRDLGSQISLSQVEYDVRVSTATSSTSSSEEYDERHKLLK